MLSASDPLVVPVAPRTAPPGYYVVESGETLGGATAVEGSVVFGLSAALHGRIDIEGGRVVQGNFHDQPVLRMPDCPVVETHVVPSALPPEGVGEPAVPPVAPAVANALFVLTGKRLRSLPLAS